MAESPHSSKELIISPMPASAICLLIEYENGIYANCVYFVIVATKFLLYQNTIHRRLGYNTLYSILIS